ncbi:MAG: DNA recombination protein RmuC [Sedimentisphaerales bacterium]|nr:DNA recombination protein RmuC [Sedimentisphaerales bacterium]
MQILIVILVIVLILAVVAVLSLLLWLIKDQTAQKEEIVRQSATVGLLQQQLEAVRGSQEKTGQVLETNLKSGQENIGRYLQTSQQTLIQLHEQIGRLRESGKQMLQLGVDVRSLQDILKNPKLRGQMGERSLENILSNILPQNSFTLQYTFKSGQIVDALVKLPDYSVPVDAKFPLPAFEAMVKAENEDEKGRLRRRFQADVTKHIDKIAQSYVCPDEGTLDFALMYIPAENVYYETVVTYGSDKTDLLDYALQKKVIPVSPNLLYAYLMTIVMGLHGLQIEKQAAEIRRDLGRLAAGFEAFTTTWEVLGRHLRNAQGQYDEGQIRLGRFQVELEQVKGKQIEC